MLTAIGVFDETAVHPESISASRLAACSEEYGQIPMSRKRAKWLIILPENLGDAFYSSGLLRLACERVNGAELHVVASAKIRSIVEKMQFPVCSVIPLEKLPAPRADVVIDLCSMDSSFRFWKSLTSASIFYRDTDEGNFVMNGDKFICQNPYFNADSQHHSANDPDVPAWAADAAVLAAALAIDVEEVVYAAQPGFELAYSAIELPHRNRPVVLFAPVGQALAKHWPEKEWIRLAEELIKLGINVKGIFGPSEKRMYGELKDLLFRSSGVLENIPIDHAARECYTADIVVAHDCSIMHLSACQGVPTIALFGPTNQRSWFRYRGKWQVSIREMAAEQVSDPLGILAFPDKPWPIWPQCDLVLDLVKSALDDIMHSL